MNEYKLLNRLVEKLKSKPSIRYNVGAVIVDRKGNILSYGFNSYVKTHPRMVYNKFFNEHQIFVHAEADAFYKLPYGSEPHTLIVCRLNKANELMNAKPCIGCFNEIQQSSIKKVYYTNVNKELALLDLKQDIEFY